MSKFNLRESLLTLDKETDFEYNLLSDYEAQSFTDEQKKQLVEMIIKKSSVEHISSFLNESIVHMRSEHEFAPLELASTLEVGEKIYDKDSEKVLTVKDIDKSKKYWVTVTFVDENGKEIVEQPGANYMYEVVGDNDTAYEVDDDIDIEWHPIDDYFNGDIDEDYNDDVYTAGYKKGDKVTIDKKSYTISDFFVDASSGRYVPMVRLYDKNDEMIRVPVSELKKKVTEDTIKTKSGKWVNKGKEGTHGEFKTKKAADAQRKAIFASGWEESLNEDTDGVTKEDKKKIAKLCKEHIGLLKRLENRDSINESVDAEKLPIAYDDIEITTYDFKHQSKETGDVPSHTFKTPYTYYADRDEVVDYIYENHFYDIFKEDEYKEIEGNWDKAYDIVKSHVDEFYNKYDYEIKEYFREKATEEANESEDWEEVEHNRFTYDEAISPAGYAPKKTGKAYKVFKVRNGKLYPPMVANKGGEDTPIGVWLDAEEGEFAGLSKTGRQQVKSIGSGTLSYRPGWHLGDVPRAPQFDRRNKETGEMEFPKDFVWAECDYAMDVDYQKDSDEQGYMRTKVDDKGNVTTYRSDKYQHSLAGLPRLPKDGYYKYRTNPRPDTVPWVITGQMKVNKLLSDDEVNAILKAKGIEPIHRQGGDKTLAELGL